MHKWQSLLHAMKTQLNKLIQICHQKSSQVLFAHGKEEMIFIPKKSSEKPTKAKLSLLKFMKQAPLNNMKLKIKRDRSPPRDVNL